MEPILQVRDLHTYFRTAEGPAKAVDGVTFSIHPGETYALVGESGCGKSVTALSILQLISKPAGRITGGSILFHATEISRLPSVAMRKIRGNRISMIFQEPMTALNPVFTVGNQISEAMILHQKLSAREARVRGIDMLRRVGIPDAAQRYDEYPHQMSGGMRQRAMIAMALSCRPELLIADEPTTALDVTVQSQILELIREQQKELGAAVLLITHDMGVVKENAHRVGVMYAGRLAEEAPVDELFANPCHPYTRLLLESLPSRAERRHLLATIPGRVPPATNFPAGCRFHNRCPFVMDICRQKPPPAFAINSDHYAECYLLDPSCVRSGHVDTQLKAPAAAPEIERQDDVRLATRDLAVHFPIRKGFFKRTVGYVKAVDGVTLSIRKGETVALVGESGCGKTTFGKCLVRLLEPTGGSILFENREIRELDRRSLQAFRRRIQMIFQDPFSSLNPRMPIDDIIREGMETHRLYSSPEELQKNMLSILERVGLAPDMLFRYPHEFSGGQRQRIGLARALAVNPDLVICDEATSSLDISVQAQILNLLRTIQKDFSLSYLLITHDLSVVRYMADYIYVMYLGRIVEEGTNSDVLANPAHPYTQALLSAVPKVDPDNQHRRIILSGDVPSPVNPPPGCHFHPRCPKARPECVKAYPKEISLTKTHCCRCILYS